MVPPLFCSAPNSGSVLLRSLGRLRPSVLPLSMLLPRLVTAVFALSPVLEATIVFSSEALPGVEMKMPPPLVAVLKAMVELMTVTACLVYNPPPEPLAWLPLSVTLLS